LHINFAFLAIIIGIAITGIITNWRNQTRFDNTCREPVSGFPFPGLAIWQGITFRAWAE
jgi:hypothetical protein